jgi:hypothetical protein
MLRVFSAASLVVAIFAIGCGSPAAPAPPSLNLPSPAQNLTASRVGNTVHLAWTMPTRTTDRVTLKHPIAARICRGVAGQSCTPIVSLAFAPGSAAKYNDELPPDLVKGEARLLHYEVAFPNRAGKVAAGSNVVYSAAGEAPAGVTGAGAQTQQKGVLLSWQTASGPVPSFFRIERLQLSAPAQPEKPRSPLAAPIPAASQTLQVQTGDHDPGHAIDSSAEFNQRYRYVVERVMNQTLAGQTVEVEGPPSEPVEVATKDVFPPAVPQGLVAVADSAAGAIDLSWSPDSDSDLAAYDVYRRDTRQNDPAHRIASVGLETSYRDTTAQPEHTYAYSLSAVDQSGNESQHSAEIEETLPSK